MNLEEKNEKKSWYDNPRFIVNLITIILLGILVYSQSISSTSNLTGWELFRNIMNVNLLYVIILLYFILIRFKVGKKYFNYCNLFLILLYFFITMTSLLTIIGSFDLILFLVLLINITLFIQMFHTFLRGTISWKEFRLERSPFNEIKSSNYFLIVFVLSTLYLVINLISSGEFSGVVLTLFVSLYYIFFSRYIHLYSVYLDSIDKDKDNVGNFDDVKEKIVNSVTESINKDEKIEESEDIKLDEDVSSVKKKKKDKDKEEKKEDNDGGDE